MHVHITVYKPNNMKITFTYLHFNETTNVLKMQLVLVNRAILLRKLKYYGKIYSLVNICKWIWINVLYDLSYDKIHEKLSNSPMQSKIKTLQADR